jgi:hypothetical protein
MMFNGKYFSALTIVIFLLPAIFGCATRGTVILESEESRVIIESKGEEPRAEETDPYYPSEVLKIPKGHMPPPGKCRIWYPDLPHGNQPPAGECEDLQYQVPSGAWLIRG